MILGNGGTILAHGRRLRPLIATAGSTSQSTRGRWRPAWPESATVFSRSMTPARNGRATAKRSTPALPQSIRLQPRAEPRECPLFHDRSRSGRPPATRSPDGPASRGRHVKLVPAGEALVSWMTPDDAGPAGTLGFFVTLDGTASPSRADPARRRSRRAGRDASPRSEASPPERDTNSRCEPSTLPATAGRKRPRNYRGFEPRARPTCPGSTSSNRLATGQRGSRTAASCRHRRRDPRRAGQDRSSDRRADPAKSPTDYLGCQPSLERRAIVRSSSRQLETNSSRSRSCCVARFSAGAIKPELVFDGPAGRHDSGCDRPLSSSRRDQWADARPDRAPCLPAPRRLRAPSIKSLHVELYIPHGVAAGEYTARLTLSCPSRSSAGDETRCGCPSRFEVWDFTLPDHLSFLPEMNCYGLPENERDYYRLAHRHRTVLNRVPYNQNGRVQDGCAPDMGRNAARARLVEVGSPVRAAAGRLGVCRSAAQKGAGRVLLSPAARELAEPDGRQLQRRLLGRPGLPGIVSPTLSSTASQADRRALRQRRAGTRRSFRDSSTTRTTSRPMAGRAGRRRGCWTSRPTSRTTGPCAISPERSTRASTRPAKETRQPVRGILAKLVFRADISRPQWRRDSLDGLIDYHVVGSAMREYPRLVFDRKRTLGEIVLEYGSTNPIEGSNLQPAAWCLDVWSLGADGVIPWQTIGNAESWNQADELSLFYPTRDRGRTSLPLQFRRSASRPIAAASRTSNT